MRKTTTTLIGLSLVSFGAWAQIPESSEPMDAQIIETNLDNRTITVEFDANGATETLRVADNAELLRTAPNDIERPIELKDIRAGAEARLEVDDIDGVLIIQRVIFR